MLVVSPSCRAFFGELLVYSLIGLALVYLPQLYYYAMAAVLVVMVPLAAVLGYHRFRQFQRQRNLRKLRQHQVT